LIREWAVRHQQLNSINTIGEWRAIVRVAPSRTAFSNPSTSILMKSTLASECSSTNPSTVIAGIVGAFGFVVM